ncbi:TM0106 family RecB-like putative nuclease [Microlunatus sp. Y2014]|uniref:TM0106 family RecB-like putative nuclease n=1 Tax=Microlunatus sp. Y2014 TaxID=3418488 RepID=UPI003DA7146B
MILLDAYAARSCAVKTHNTFDPGVTLVAGPIDEGLQELFDQGQEFEDQQVAQLLAAVPGLVDLREVEDRAEAARRLRAATAAGVVGVVGGSLPIDTAGHRVGRVDLLLRGPDRPDGSAGYLPVEIKRHRVLERRRAKTDSPAAWLAPFHSPTAAVETLDRRFRYGSREGDLVQLAHYWRMLEAAGLAAGGEPWVGVIGNDPEPGGVITWVRLDAPVARTFSRTAATGWVRRSILERYDHEFAFRLDVAEVAAHQGEADARPPLVEPIRVDECARCPWWEYCRSAMDADDLSLRLDKGPLDVREISVLRRRGIGTVTELAAADLAELLPDYLAEVTHRDNAESRIRTAHRRAVMLAEGTTLARITQGAIAVPTAPVEIDFDLEASADQHVYLWGFLVNDGDSSSYVPFAEFSDLDDAGEVALAVRALTWLRTQVVDHGATVHHYSGYEVTQLLKLAERSPEHEVLQWACEATGHDFVDLYEVVRQHWFGVNGLGLKQVAAQGAGFAWRDEDPGGLNSQTWFHEAVHGEDEATRLEARDRVLAYNEDDVTATREVRRWLRSQSARIS